MWELIFSWNSLSWNWALLRMNPTLSSLIRPVAKVSCGTFLISLWQNQFPDIDFLKEEFSEITLVIWNVIEKCFCLFLPIKKDEINSVYEINTNYTFVQIMTDSLRCIRFFHQVWFKIQNYIGPIFRWNYLLTIAIINLDKFKKYQSSKWKSFGAI